MSITSIVVALLIFNGVVILHEFGHYIAARKCGVGIIEFSIGFGPRIITFCKKNTRFSIKALPFGGSCEMLGEQEEDVEEIYDEKSFYNTKSWKKALIIAAGPGFNLLTALIASFCIIMATGVDQPIVTHVIKDSPAAEAGLQVGDEIVFYNGNKIANAREYKTDLSLDGVPEQITVMYKRNGVVKHISFNHTEINAYRLGIQYKEKSNTITFVAKNGAAEMSGLEAGDIITSINDIVLTDNYAIMEYLGEHPVSDEEIRIAYIRNGESYKTKLTPTTTTNFSTGFELSGSRAKVSIPKSVKAAFGEVGYYTHVVIKSFVSLINGNASVNDMSGPVGTVKAMGEAYDQAAQDGMKTSVDTIMNLTVLLSALLGVTNLLPIPPLDGCQLLVFAIESIRRKPINERVVEAINSFGFICVMALLFFVTVADIGKIFR